LTTFYNCFVRLKASNAIRALLENSIVPLLVGHFGKRVREKSMTRLRPVDCVVGTITE